MSDGAGSRREGSGLERRDPGYGDIWLVDFGRATGLEAAGTRPAIVLQNDVLDAVRTVMVVPLTTASGKDKLAGSVWLAKEHTGLRQDSAAVCFLVTAISREKVRHNLGRLLPRQLAEVEEEVIWCLGFSSQWSD